MGGEKTEVKLKEVFDRKPKYAEVSGLCRATTLAEIAAQGLSLNPGRSVGVSRGEGLSNEDFRTQFHALNEELEGLNAGARELKQTIAINEAEIPGV